MHDRRKVCRRPQGQLMRYLISDAPSPASVTTHIPGATPLWVAVLCSIGALIVLRALVLNEYPSLNGSPVVIFTWIVGIAIIICAGTKISPSQHDQLHPSASSVAKKLGLSPVAGSDNSFRDASGHRYDGCSANSKKIDGHHVSSTLLCTLDGKPVFAPQGTSS